MKRLLFVSLLSVISCTYVFAHDGTLDPATFTGDTFVSVDRRHDEPPDGTPPDDFKGWADITITNMMTQDWGDFHFELTDFELEPSVYFVHDDPAYAPWAEGLTDYSVEFDAWTMIGGNMQPQQVNFLFYDYPATYADQLTFHVYTDNTTNTNAWFSMTIYPTPVPEPATLALFALGAFAVLRRRNK